MDFAFPQCCESCTHPPIKWKPGAFSLEVSGPGVKLVTHLHLVPMSKKEWMYTLSPQYAFMVWCSVKIVVVVVVVLIIIIIIIIIAVVRRRWEDTISLREMDRMVRTVFICLLEGFCRHGNGPCSIKGGEFLD
jgi:uncharacterized membrane protein